MIARLFAVALSLAIASGAPAQATWPQWRGPNRDGTVAATPAWPDSLSETSLTKIWRTEDLGPSYSGVIVGLDKVFITETVGKKDEIVRALDRKTGKEVWKTAWAGSMTVPFFAAENGSWVRSTPAFDGDSLYVGGIRDVIVCLDAKTGTERWRVDCMKEFGTPLPAFGCSSSPMVDETAVYVQAANAFLKLDKKSGKLIWKTLVEGKDAMLGSAFSSPTFAKVAGKDQILVQTRTKLAGVVASSGDVLWSKDIPAMRGMNILTPTVYGNDSVFTSAYGGKSMLVTLKADGDKLTPSDAWSRKWEAYMSSPVVIDGHAYMHLRSRRVMCLRLSDGKECWTTEKSFGRYWSMVAQKDKILVLDERGTLLLLRANPEKFDVIDERKLPYPESWAHLAVAGDEVYVRDLTGVTAYRWK